MDKYLAVTRDPEMAAQHWNRDKLPASTALQVNLLSDPCSSIRIDLVAVVE
jgi:hypothetical protein